MKTDAPAPLTFPTHSGGAPVVKLHARTETDRRGRVQFVGWRAVLQLDFADLGALGAWAVIETGTGREIVNARELLSLDWLENLSAATDEKSASQKKAGAVAA